MEFKWLTRARRICRNTLLHTEEMSHAPIVPGVRKRSKPADVSVPGREEVKFEDVRLYLVERKMGRSRRSFLTQLARSKGFIVDDVLRLEMTFCFIRVPKSLSEYVPRGRH